MNVYEALGVLIKASGVSAKKNDVQSILSVQRQIYHLRALILELSSDRIETRQRSLAESETRPRDLSLGTSEKFNLLLDLDKVSQKADIQLFRRKEKFFDANYTFVSRARHSNK